MMAEEGASSSSNSFDEAEERRGPRPATYTSSFISHAPADGSCTSVSSTGHMACVNPVSGMIGISRLSYNPFAIKTATPTRSLADSTDNKESRPLVAPPTLKLGGIGSKQDGKENKLDDSNNVGSKEINSTNCESNGKISKSEFLASGLPASSDGTSRIMTSTPSKSSGMGESSFGFTPNKTEDKAADGASFIFGQNLHERVLNYDDSGMQPSSPADVHNLTFEEAASQKEELEKKEREEQEAKFTKSLTESAKEYQSKQIKRKFDEVTVITGEEEESNVLQMNCKLFAFNKLNSSWQERGRGILRLNDREVNGVLHSRVVMRTQGSLRVVLNTKVWSGMSVEHPSQKTVRLTAIDMQGVKVFLVMANPKDAEQLFSALDWRVTTLKSQEESSNKNYGDKPKSTVEEATSSSGLPDTSSNENYGDSPNKRSKLSLSQEGGADSSTEMDFFPGATSEISSDSFVDSTDASNTPCHDLGDGTSLVSD